jgi:NADPH:quinone reductase-like Zn-dependent oxidoreductase
MKALMHVAFGAPETALTLVELPDPKPGKGEVLVAVEAAPINGADLMSLAGRMRGEAPSLPQAFGTEGVGRVVALGEGVTRFANGDRVLVPKYLGSFRELLVCKEDDTYHAPDQGDAAQFAILSTMGQTAELMLQDHVPLKPGQWLLQNGGTSSIARLISGLAKDRGWKSISLVRRPGVEEELKSYGADHVIVDPGNAEELVKQVNAASDGVPMTAALDMVGGDLVSRMMRTLGRNGTLVLYGRQSGKYPEIEHTLIAQRDLMIRGMVMGVSWNKRSADQQRMLMEKLAKKAGTGIIKTKVAETFALKDYLAAFRLAAEPNAVRDGKVIIRPLQG